MARKSGGPVDVRDASVPVTSRTPLPAADVVWAGWSLVMTRTRQPASASCTALVRPTTPAPTTTASRALCCMAASLRDSGRVWLCRERAFQVGQEASGVRVASATAQVRRELVQQGVAAGGPDRGEPAYRGAGLAACGFEVTTGGVGEGEPCALVQGAALGAVTEWPVVRAGTEHDGAAPEQGSSRTVAVGEVSAAGQDQGVSALAVQVAGGQVVQPWRVRLRVASGVRLRRSAGCSLALADYA